MSAAAVALLAIALVAPNPAEATFKTGVADPRYESTDPGTRDVIFDETVAAGAEVVRISVNWREIATQQPTDPGNPADPAYDFTLVDAAVQDAAERGLVVLLLVERAPSYAERGDAPPDAPTGSWYPDPGAFGQFGRAVAIRYSGSFNGLPTVRFYQAWAEPNLSTYLTPQWQSENGGAPVAALHYRYMLNAFYKGVKGVSSRNKVVTGGLAPYGDPAGGQRMRPLRFLRALLCLRDNLEPRKCTRKARFDIVSAHPINLSGGPRRSALHPDDATTPDFKHIRKTVRAAERTGTVRPRGKRHPLWATELWWMTNPPNSTLGVGLRQHARWIADALYLLWKQGARLVMHLPLRDPGDKPLGGVWIAAGLRFFDGRLKPGHQAFRFPFVTERISELQLRAWGMSPAAGRLRIERHAEGRWRTVKVLKVGEGSVFQTQLSVRGKQRLRAKVGTETSVVWAQRR